MGGAVRFSGLLLNATEFLGICHHNVHMLLFVSIMQ